MVLFYGMWGWGIFWISLIVGIILFVKSKKLYPVIYLISIALYVFTAGFVIDAYSLGKLGILLTLVISAIVFMLLGYYFSKIIHSKEQIR